jgi:hypothetical protein
MKRRCETVREIETCIILHLCSIATMGYQAKYTMDHCDYGVSHSFIIAVGHCDWAIRGLRLSREWICGGWLGYHDQ